MNQAIYKAMQRLVHSTEGIKRAVRATNDGDPALAGVDVLLRQELGAEYARAVDGGWWAGFTVAQVMRDLGFVEAGTGKCPEGCIAGEGTVWKSRSEPKIMTTVVR
jgi:hypothetical protein